MFPARSDDAVRNRYTRLRQGQELGRGPGTGRATQYKCARCGLPKKKHVCLAPLKVVDMMKQRDAKELKVLRRKEQKWTKAEDTIILSMARKGDAYSTSWKDVAAALPGRTAHAARNRYFRLRTA